MQKQIIEKFANFVFSLTKGTSQFFKKIENIFFIDAVPNLCSVAL